ncbi:MAG: type II toxin-antitoxin system RelE/ParE family toxin [Methanobrevibacter sp.]|jgi:mRNA-degrading endonuclease RelE of RelBE toxin-antitoxin system|nr:type II toxin-antitoxin system RelE/ParE family toxin [Methanobrevibacter sp.]
MTDMDEYKLIISKNLDKYLLKLSKKDQNYHDIIKEAKDEIKHNPYNSKNLTCKLQDYRRVRKGDYRIIFRIDKTI